MTVWSRVLISQKVTDAWSGIRRAMWSTRTTTQQKFTTTNVNIVHPMNKLGTLKVCAAWARGALNPPRRSGLLYFCVFLAEYVAKLMSYCWWCYHINGFIFRYLALSQCYHDQFPRLQAINGITYYKEVHVIGKPPKQLALMLRRSVNGWTWKVPRTATIESFKSRPLYSPSSFSKTWIDCLICSFLPMCLFPYIQLLCRDSLQSLRFLLNLLHGKLLTCSYLYLSYWL